MVGVPEFGSDFYQILARCLARMLTRVFGQVFGIRICSVQFYWDRNRVHTNYYYHCRTYPESGLPANH